MQGVGAQGLEALSKAISTRMKGRAQQDGGNPKFVFANGEEGL